MNESDHRAVDGAVALVTGASRGIGRAVALALASAGVDVAVNYHHREDAAIQVRDAIEERGRRAVVVRADVSRGEEVLRMVETVGQQLGPISILVNNAGIAEPRSIDGITETDWDRTINVNLKSAFLVTQAVLPSMRRESWGRIINISSAPAQLGGIIGPHYTASKAGMLGLTRAYARQLAPEGITVNAISPALIDTEMIADNPLARPDAIPVGRFGAVDEIAEIVVMLARNGYITGQSINPNGGAYMT